MKLEHQAPGDWWPHLESQCLMEIGESSELSCPQLRKFLSSCLVEVLMLSSL